jgi:AraC-like DNA-binding protein
MFSRGHAYSWQVRNGQEASVRTAAEIVHRRIRTSERTIHDLWALDYNFTPGERIRLGSVDAPWIPRPAYVAHLYAPGTAYWEDVGDDGTPVNLHCAYILFADTGLLRLDALLPDSPRHARFLDEHGTLGNLFHEIVEIGVTEGEEGYWQAHAQFFRLLSLLHNALPLGKGVYRIQDTRGVRAYSEFAQEILTFCKSHIAEPITIADLAGELGMSSSALAHRYRAETGETPMSALRRERINLAKALLAKGYRLKEIAAHTGFSDEFHLSKVFKQIEGVSPKAYRQSLSSPTCPVNVCNRT